MARVTAVQLRDEARAAMLEAGGRGFMRFAEDGALLVTDALRRCENEEARARLRLALEREGFFGAEKDGLLFLTPGDARLCAIDAPLPMIDWAHALHPAQALAVRLMKNEKRPLKAGGRQMILETLRLTWQAEGRVLGGLETLSARAAVLKRQGDRSGLYEAGAVLALWCDTIKGGRPDEA